MAITYNRAKNTLSVDQLTIGKFYRDADECGEYPRIFLVTDEDQLVTLSGIQYTTCRPTNQGYIEVQVDITVGEDV